MNEPPHTPSPDVPSDIRNIIPLSTAIPEGQFFLKAGSVNTAVKSRPKRIQKNESKIDGIAACVKNPMKDKVAASRTYAEHVEKPSISWSKEPTGAPSPDQANATKIRIRGFHISEQEFVQSLVPNGVVGHNFMWVCCVAIMEDWGSRTKFILNQTIVVISQLLVAVLSTYFCFLYGVVHSVNYSLPTERAHEKPGYVQSRGSQKEAKEAASEGCRAGIYHPCNNILQQRILHRFDTWKKL